MKGKELLRGVGAAPGKAVGLVRIAATEADKKALKPGEVYVDEHPTPDDNAYMKQASAIVTDRGGRTAHAAMMARMWGVPAVTGTVNATRALKTGQHVLVDGGAAKDERGRDIGIVYEWIPGPGEIPSGAVSAKITAPGTIDRLSQLAHSKGLVVDPAFLEKLKRRQ